MRFLLSLSLILLALSYDQHNDYNYIMNYYEENSQFPIVHVHYNSHFSRSRQF